MIEFPSVTLPVHIGIRFGIPLPVICADSGIGMARTVNIVVAVTQANVFDFMMSPYLRFAAHISGYVPVAL
jgi:hypothetical protein